jgi:hypothetical protein
MPKITVTAEMPKELLQFYLQNIRNFEVEHFNEVELRITIDANMPTEEAEKLLERISPPYAYRTTINTNDGQHTSSRIKDQLGYALRGYRIRACPQKKRGSRRSSARQCHADDSSSGRSRGR